MMSNGPCSSRRSFQSGTRSTVAASTSSGVSITKMCRKPSLRETARTTAAVATSGCGRRAGRSPGRCDRRFRSWQTRSGRSSTIATGRQWYCRASSTSGLRASGWTLVASTTVSRPRASRLPAMKRSTSKASLVTAWSFSSSLDHRPASVGREDLGRQEMLARERALARAAGADQDDEAELGISICIDENSSYVCRAGRASLDRLFEQILVHVPPSPQGDQLRIQVRLADQGGRFDLPDRDRNRRPTI